MKLGCTCIKPSQRSTVTMCPLVSKVTGFLNLWTWQMNTAVWAVPGWHTFEEISAGAYCGNVIFSLWKPGSIHGFWICPEQSSEGLSESWRYRLTVTMWPSASCMSLTGMPMPLADVIPPACQGSLFPQPLTPNLLLFQLSINVSHCFLEARQKRCFNTRSKLEV